jgi:hypothetical protein
MRHPSTLSWRQDSPSGWTGLIDGAPVARISFGRQYELESSDGLLHGSHSSLESAQAQFGAWSLWDAVQSSQA